MTGWAKATEDSDDQSPAPGFDSLGKNTGNDCSGKEAGGRAFRGCCSVSSSWPQLGLCSEGHKG